MGSCADQGDQSRPEQTRADQSRPEQIRADQSRAASTGKDKAHITGQPVLYNGDDVSKRYKLREALNGKAEEAVDSKCKEVD
jgi:hypothetical protein